MSHWIPGLAGVVAAQTSVSRVDGDAGGLWFRGQPVMHIATQGFEATAAVVLNRSVHLGEARVAAFRRQAALSRLPRGPMAGLRALLASAVTEDAASIIAEVAVAVARVASEQTGRPALEPDPAADHAADLFRMVVGREPEPAEARALGLYLSTIMDHGLNASTFAARVVASTRSDTVSAVVAAIGALKGPLHGGAPGPVLDMLDGVGTPDRAARWVQQELEAGRRIMGMGHRVYRVRDPRAAVLETGLSGLVSDRLMLARAVEVAAEAALAERYPGRSLRANVEFYTAVLLDALGMDRSLFTPMFAAGRVVGWLAHIEEERAAGTLLRPRAEYIGPPCVMA